MISITLKNQQHQIIRGKLDHEREIEDFQARGEQLATLAIKDYAYQTGDYIEVEVTAANYYVVQLEETLAPSLVYIPDKRWLFHIDTDQARKKAMVETVFSSKRHSLQVRLAHQFEIEAYQNLSFNAYAQKTFTGAYPYAHANVETRDDVVFFAKNAIDGKYGNVSHGSYPFASWGINQQQNAELTIDFGREVIVDCIGILLRCDFPHDSYWKAVNIAFSDNTSLTFNTSKTCEFQMFQFPSQTTTYITFGHLVKAEDASPFPALTQLEVFGKNKL